MTASEFPAQFVHLSSAADLPLSAHSRFNTGCKTSRPVLAAISATLRRRHRAEIVNLSPPKKKKSESSLQTCRPNQKSNVLPLFADGISPIFIKHGPSPLPCLPPPKHPPSGYRAYQKMTGTSAHLSHLSPSPSLCHTSRQPNPTHTHRPTDTHLSYITTYDTLHS